jgi:cyclase
MMKYGLRRQNSDDMHKIVLFLLILLSFCSCNSTLNNNPTISEIDTLIKIEKLSDRVVVVRLGWDAVTAISTKKGMVVIDAGISNSVTARYRALIEKGFRRNDFAFLINTHSHPDHVGGNQVFSDAIIIGHDSIVPEMDRYWKNIDKIRTGLQKTALDYSDQLKKLGREDKDYITVRTQNLRYKAALHDLSKDRIVTKPSVTFSDMMSLDMGDITFDLIYFGKAHSASDIMVYIPEEQLLMTGDLFSPGGRTWLGEAEKEDMERWNKTLDWLTDRTYKISIVISGHGEIMTYSDLEAFRNRIIERANQFSEKTPH